MRSFRKTIGILFVFAASCNHAPVKQEASQSKTKQTEISNEPYYAVFQNADGSYGYDIYVEKKKYIHQPNIPAIPGNKGFESEQDAIVIAQMVIQKIKVGQLPPSLNAEEVIGAIQLKN